MSFNTSDIDTPDIRLLTSARIPTRFGEFQLGLYENSIDEKDHLTLIHGDISAVEDVLVRVHSECYTGDVLGSLRCDCGDQLNASMRMIAEEGTGIILYLRQEGRGIGLHDKLRAYNLQDEGYDTVDANIALGHGADERDYTIGALMLQDLGVHSVRLITNNPEKIESLETYGIDIVERVPLQPRLNEHNTDYLQTKVERMHHMLELKGETTLSNSAESTSADAVGRDAVLALQQAIIDHTASVERPFVTLLYRQHLDGSIQPPFAPDQSDGSDLYYTFLQRIAEAHDALLIDSDSSQIPQLNEAKVAALSPDREDVVHYLQTNLSSLTEEGVQSVLMVADGTVIEKVINCQIADYMMVFMSSFFIPNNNPVSIKGKFLKLINLHVDQIGDDVLIQGIMSRNITGVM